LLRETSSDLVTYRFESLDRPDLTHAVYTRYGGTSRGALATLNVGGNVGDEPSALAENHRRIYAYLGIPAERVVTARQVHGNKVTPVTLSHAGSCLDATDGLVTQETNLALLLRFADCQPILLYDPVNHCLGLLHAGWQGIALGIARRGVEIMKASFGSRPEDLLAGLGPAIGPCCYVVGDNVAAAMGYALPDWSQVMTAVEGGWRLDLELANAQQLRAAGVTRIEHSGLCTSCHVEQFYSHRAEAGTTGRFAVAAFLRPRDHTARGLQAKAQEQESPLTPPTDLGSLNAPGLPALWEQAGDAE
jgi:polyphenol oxidase